MTFERPSKKVGTDAVRDRQLAIDRTQVSADALLALALRYNLTSYDAANLNLAMRLRLPIAANDGALRNAAEAAGVGVVMA